MFGHQDPLATLPLCEGCFVLSIAEHHPPRDPGRMYDIWHRKSTGDEQVQTWVSGQSRYALHLHTFPGCDMPMVSPSLLDGRG